MILALMNVKYKVINFFSKCDFIISLILQE